MEALSRKRGDGGRTPKLLCRDYESKGVFGAESEQSCRGWVKRIHISCRDGACQRCLLRAGGVQLSRGNLPRVGCGETVPLIALSFGTDRNCQSMYPSTRGVLFGSGALLYSSNLPGKHEADHSLLPRENGRICLRLRVGKRCLLSWSKIDSWRMVMARLAEFPLSPSHMVGERGNPWA